MQFIYQADFLLIEPVSMFVPLDTTGSISFTQHIKTSMKISDQSSAATDMNFDQNLSKSQVVLRGANEEVYNGSSPIAPVCTRKGA